MKKKHKLSQLMSVILFLFVALISTEGRSQNQAVELFCTYTSHVEGVSGTTRFIIDLEKGIIRRLDSVGILHISDRMEDRQMSGNMLAAYGNGRSFVFAKDTGEFALAWTLIARGGNASAGYIEGKCNRPQLE